MKQIDELQLLLTFILLDGLSACSTSLKTPITPSTHSSPIFTQTASIPPTSTSISITVSPLLTESPATVIQSSRQVTLISLPYTETYHDPRFSITVQIPHLQGSEDPSVQTLNQILNETIQKEMKLFRDDFLLYGAKPLPSGSTMDGSYVLTAQYADIWSFKLDFLYYYDNAKVPVHFSIPVNYDLAQGKTLTLSDLFVQNSNYLERISEYCIGELGKRNPTYPIYGATYPQAGNYDNWNITPDGLMIIFNPSEVAPSEQGLQTVVVPYTHLQAVIDSDGVLGKIKK